MSRTLLGERAVRLVGVVGAEVMVDCAAMDAYVVVGGPAVTVAALALSNADEDDRELGVGA